LVVHDTFYITGGDDDAPALRNTCMGNCFVNGLIGTGVYFYYLVSRKNL
jgi:hypothetical protein